MVRSGGRRRDCRRLRHPSCRTRTEQPATRGRGGGVVPESEGSRALFLGSSLSQSSVVSSSSPCRAHPAREPRKAPLPAPSVRGMIIGRSAPSPEGTRVGAELGRASLRPVLSWTPGPRSLRDLRLTLRWRGAWPLRSQRGDEGGGGARRSQSAPGAVMDSWSSVATRPAAQSE